MIRIWMSRFSRKTRAQGTPRSRRLRAVLRLEGLEARQLLSGTPDTYIVDSTAPGDTGSGAEGTLAYTIAAADTDSNPAGTQIEFDPTVFIEGAPTIDLAFTLDLSNSNPMLIEGNGNVTISGGESIQPFDVTFGATVTIDDVTITSGAAAMSGGDIQNNGTLTVEDSSILDGATGANGGGIANTDILTLTDATVGGNDAVGTMSGGSLEPDTGEGGGIYNIGTLTISGGTIETNTAADAGGGLCNIDPSTTATVTSTRVYGNMANYGGGVANSSDGSVTLDGTTLEANTSAESGGGIYNAASSGVEVIYSQIVFNTAGVNGGALSNPGGHTDISDTNIVDNSAANVGGAIADNDGTYDGTTYDGTVNTANDTIVDNSVPAGQSGGGVYVFSGNELLLNNTIVGLNTAGTGSAAAASDITGTADASSGYNLIGTGGSGGLVDGTDGNMVGVTGSAMGVEVSTTVSPPSVTLSPDSPAIDAGSNALAVDPSNGDALGDDDAGNPRIINGTVDIGAYEATIPDADLTLFVSTEPASSVSTTDSFGLIVEAMTPQGNVETDFSGPVTLTLSGSGGGSLGGTSVMDAVDGVATFSGLSIASAGDYTIEAASGSLATTSTATIDVTAPSTGTGSTGTGSTGTGSTGTGSTGTGSTGTGSTGTGTPIVSTPLPTPPALVSETVLYVGKGRHKRIAGFDLEFSQPLGASAGDPAEYVLTQVVKHGRKLTSQPVAFTVDYGLGTQEVGLAIARKVPFTLGGQLRVVGSGPGGITSSTGVALDGSDIGLAGNDGYFAILPKGRGIQPT